MKIYIRKIQRTDGDMLHDMGFKVQGKNTWDAVVFVARPEGKIVFLFQNYHEARCYIKDHTTTRWYSNNLFKSELDYQYNSSSKLTNYLLKFDIKT